MPVPPPKAAPLPAWCRSLLLGLLLAWLATPAAGQGGSTSYLKWFPAMVLAPAEDWHRPDLARHGVRQLRRRFDDDKAADQWPTAPREFSGGYYRRSWEELTYNRQGQLLSYYLRVRTAQRPARQWLRNTFEYDAQQRLTRIRVDASPAFRWMSLGEEGATAFLVNVAGSADWRSPALAAYTERHGFAPREWTGPGELALHELRFAYTATGTRYTQAAAVALASQRQQPSSKKAGDVTWRNVYWADTLRGAWVSSTRIITAPADTLTLLDSTFVTDPARWVLPDAQLTDSVTPGPWRAVQYRAVELLSYRGNANRVFLTEFYDPRGRLRLSRDWSGEVARYEYDANNRLARHETYGVVINYSDEKLEKRYYGSRSQWYTPLPDCARKLSWTVPVDSGRHITIKQYSTQELRYQPRPAGPPRLGLLELRRPRVDPPAAFDQFGRNLQLGGRRRYRELILRGQQYNMQGCLPMTEEVEYRYIRYRYRFYPPADTPENRPGE